MPFSLALTWPRALTTLGGGWLIHYWHTHRTMSLGQLWIRFWLTIAYNMLVRHYRRSSNYDHKRYPNVRPSAELLAMDKLFLMLPDNVRDREGVFAKSTEKAENLWGQRLVLIPVFRFVMKHVLPVAVHLPPVYLHLPPFTSIYLHLPAFTSIHLQFTCILPPFHLRLTSISPPAYLHFTSGLPPFHLHSASSLPPFYLHSTSSLPPVYL